MSSNPYAAEVEEWEILPDEVDKPIGKRLTYTDCTICAKPLSEAVLCDIRMARAYFRHYECEDGSYLVMGDDVRDDDPNDKFYEATRHLKLGRMEVDSGGFVRYNGKSAVIRPCGYAPCSDAETNHPSIQLAIRRGWLKPWVKPEDRWQNKIIAKVKSIFGE